MTKNPPTKATTVAAAVAAAIAGTVETVMLHPSRIAPSPTNPRKTFPEASLIELGASMVADGQVQAITVRKMSVDAHLRWNRDHPDQAGPDAPEYELVVGERRWRAATLGGFELRAEIRELTDLQVVRIQIIENLHREEVHPLEEAEGYEYLLHHSAEGISVDQIADEVGKSRSYIHKRMKLAALCPDARKAFYAGEFDASTALLIARLATPGLQLQAIKEIGEIWTQPGDKPSYRQIKAHLARRFHLDLSDAPFDITDVSLVPACGSCAACPKRTGNQPMLFDEDAGPDVCTDPDCFGEKKAASIANALAAARKQGLKVIEGEDAKALKPHHWREPEGYKNLDAVAYQDAEENDVTYAQLAEQAGKKAPKPVVFVDPHHPGEMPDKLITDEEATKLLAKFAPAEARAGTKAQRARKEETAEEKARRQEWEAERRQAHIQRELNGMLSAALLSKADKPRTIEDLIVVIFALAGEDIGDKLLEAAGVTLPEDDDASAEFDHEGALYAALQALQPVKLGEIVLRLALGELTEYYSGSVPTAALEAAAKVHKINVDGMRKKAEAKVDSPDDEQDADE